MKLRFTRNTEIEIALEVNDLTEVITDANVRVDTVAEGMVADVELLDETDEIFIVQFEDDTVGNIPKDAVELLRVDEEVDEIEKTPLIDLAIPDRQSTLDTTPPREVIKDLVTDEAEALNGEDDDDDGILTPEERQQLADELAARNQSAVA